MSKEEIENRIHDLEMKSTKIVALRKENEELKKQKDDLFKRVEELGDIREEREDLMREVESLSAQLSLSGAFTKALRIMAEEIIDEILEKKVAALVAKAEPPSSGALEVEKTDMEVIVNVKRETVTASEESLRGQIAILISEDYFSKYRSARSTGRELKNLGVQISESSGNIISELNWFTRQRIMEHDDKQGWRLRDGAKVRVLSDHPML